MCKRPATVRTILCGPPPAKIRKNGNIAGSYLGYGVGHDPGQPDVRARWRREINLSDTDTPQEMSAVQAD